MTPTSSLSKKETFLRRYYNRALEISFGSHLAISALLRFLLIYYGQLHDAHSEVPYTDVDYKVVTDGAREILDGRSPFARHTYRYSPLLAYLQLLNVLVHPSAGKLIYCCFDLFVAILIYSIVRLERQSHCRRAVEPLPRNANDKRTENIARGSACFWLYNPLTAVISTRGNGDSFSSFFVILTIYLLTKSEDPSSCRRRNWLIFAAGVAHGFAIHLRLYPVLFSLAYFLVLSDRLTCTIGGFVRAFLGPSHRQFLLISGTAAGLVVVTGLFYWLYGWHYIYEAYLYHFVRKDTRHNFSLYFLMQYLSGGAAEASTIEKVLILTPQIVLILYLSFAFGQFRQTLPFCVFALTFVAVTFNSVVTSQYFVWYLAFLPLCLSHLRSISLVEGSVYLGLWTVGQGLWLLPAYLLEFKTWNTFYWIGAQGALFFLINNFLLTRLIQHYDPAPMELASKKLS